MQEQGFTLGDPQAKGNGGQPHRARPRPETPAVASLPLMGKNLVLGKCLRPRRAAETLAVL
jgi:hypothetical protein